MIVIYTNYDDVTEILETFALQFIVLAGSAITLDLGPPDDSISTNIQVQLGGPTKSVFFFGHGRLHLSALEAQDEVPAIDGQNLHLLRDRLVYAACCDSTVILDPAVKKHNATVIGYNDKLRVPLGGRYRALMENCVLAGARALLSGQDAGDARKGIQQEFRLTAQQLIGTGRVRDAVMSVKVFDWNANIAALNGNPSRTI